MLRRCPPMPVPMLRTLGSRALAIGKPLLQSAVESMIVVLLLGTFVFFALRLLPGDPAALLLGDHASTEERARVLAKLHLDESLSVQFARFLRGLVTLDLGESLRYPGQAAFARVALALRATAQIAVVSVGLGALFGVGTALLGVGPWLGPWRTKMRGMLDALAALPLLSFAPLATLLFAVKLRVVPLPGDLGAPTSGMLFASVLLALPLGAHLGRTALSLLEGIASQPFMRVAVAKGAAPLRVWIRHALPTVSGPIITIVATQLGALLGGAVVLERLFERPGLGLLVLEAYASRDLPVLEAAVVSTGAVFVGVQMLGALVYSTVDPRAGGAAR